MNNNFTNIMPDGFPNSTHLNLNDDLNWKELINKGRWTNKILTNNTALNSQTTYTFTCNPSTYFYPMHITCQATIPWQANLRINPDIVNYDVYDAAIFDNYLGLLGGEAYENKIFTLETPSIKITDNGRLIVQIRPLSGTGTSFISVIGIETAKTVKLQYKAKIYVSAGDSTTYTLSTKFYSDIIYEYSFGQSAPFELVNKGIGSSNSSKMYNVMDYWLLDVDFDLISICLGLNDSVNGTQVPLSSYTSNMRYIINRILISKPHAEVIAIAPPSTTSSTRIDYIQSYRDALNSVVNEFSSTGKVYYVDASQAYSTALTATYTSDGLHPNLSGQTAIAAQILPTFVSTKFFSNCQSMYNNYITTKKLYEVNTEQMYGYLQLLNR